MIRFWPDKKRNGTKKVLGKCPKFSMIVDFWRKGQVARKTVNVFPVSDEIPGNY